jgi:predicted Rossmann fold flavoprotein
VLEKTARTGTKILASGGTRCNLTTTLGPADAGRLFGPTAERFLRPALAALPPARVVETFEALGVPCVEAPLEKVFPASQRARDVRDALERACLELGVEFRFRQRVLAVAPEEGGYRIEVEGEEGVHAGRVLLCPGGRSYPGTGTTGDGYAWLRQLDLPVVETVPALVPLTSPEPWVHALSGLAVQDAEVRLVDSGGKVLARRTRPLLFTHEGLSGPGAMDVSGHVAAAVARDPSTRFEVAVDLVPDLDREELRERLVSGASAAGSPGLGRVLEQRLPRRLLEAACSAAGLPSSPRARDLDRASRHALIEALKGLRVPVDGTLGFDRAEVTRGGLSLRALNPRTLEVNGFPGLHALGELLDLDGPIGGLNFQAAFATAELAARHATQAP